jgi:hypothetical protein
MIAGLFSDLNHLTPIIRADIQSVVQDVKSSVAHANFSAGEEIFLVHEQGSLDDTRIVVCNLSDQKQVKLGLVRHWFNQHETGYRAIIDFRLKIGRDLNHERAMQEPRFMIENMMENYNAYLIRRGKELVLHVEGLPLERFTTPNPKPVYVDTQMVSGILKKSLCKPTSKGVSQKPS